MPQRQPDTGREAPELATVFATGSLALLGLAKAVLESAGIPFVTKGELIDSAGAERFGDLEIQVRREQAEEARALLVDIREGQRRNYSENRWPA